MLLCTLVLYVYPADTVFYGKAEMVNKSKTETRRSGEIASPDLIITETDSPSPKRRRKSSFLIDNKYSIADLVDLDSLQSTLESFSKATGLTTGLYDNRSGMLLFSHGWSDICSQFHTNRTKSTEPCIENNNILISRKDLSRPLDIYVCKYGLAGGAMPIIIQGVHLADILAGQIFFEEPDPERFMKQAAEFGYDQEEYLEAMRRVPVIAAERFRELLDFLRGVSVMIADTGLSRLQNMERAASLERKAAEMQRADRELKKLNRDLESAVNENRALVERSNKELEAFSYSISHDLRTPLRAINGFTHIILDDYADSLNDEVKRYLKKVQQGTLQMDSLIKSLLEFFRLGSQPLAIQKVKIQQIVQTIMLEISEECSGREVEYAIGTLPNCNGDPALLRVVFRNIISNAVKFTRNNEKTVVEVGFVQMEKETAYYVKDNGVGFDMRHSRRLFGLFQRLHHADEFEGDGVGLAVARRIVHLHKGRIWVEAEKGRGATFYFTIPGKPSHRRNGSNSSL